MVHSALQQEGWSLKWSFPEEQTEVVLLWTAYLEKPAAGAIPWNVTCFYVEVLAGTGQNHVNIYSELKH